MRPILVIVFFLFLLFSQAQEKIENVIVITTDGLRWQEIFGGMDSAIAGMKAYNQGDKTYIQQTYWADDIMERRKKLMPFFWSTMATDGNIYGNRKHGNFVNNANPYWFSYPGYNEIFTGYPDTAVNSNDYMPNPHVTILEYLHQLPKYNGKVAAFSAWDAFDRILNEKRAGFQVVSAFDSVAGKLNARQLLSNAMKRDSYRPFGSIECLDVFTHYNAFEYLKAHKPKVLYISYGETDEWAHHGYYRSYLDAAHQVDQWVNNIWSFVQHDPVYRNKTALIFTTDHGRGDIKKTQWTDHGQSVADASEIWLAIMAPGLTGKGEIKVKEQWYQKQIAQTIASILGLTYAPKHPVGEPINLR
ncbi:MAG: hypothetical protein RL335_692 [Bacteroidota bacterium]|jgi:hypothetical protein